MAFMPSESCVAWQGRGHDGSLAAAAMAVELLPRKAFKVAARLTGTAAISCQTAMALPQRPPTSCDVPSCHLSSVGDEPLKISQGQMNQAVMTFDNDMMFPHYDLPSSDSTLLLIL